MKKLMIISLVLTFLFSCNHNSQNNCGSNPQWTKITSAFDNVNVYGLYSPYTFCSIGTNFFVGYATGGYMSNDGGSTWTLITKNLSALVNINNVLNYDTTVSYIFTDGNSLFAAINQNYQTSQPSAPKFFKSTDFGNTWSQVWSSYNSSAKSVTSISFVNNKIFLVSSGGDISTSSDNGNSWTYSYNPSSNIPCSPVITDGTNFYSAQAGTLLMSNNGLNFSPVQSDSLQGMFYTTPSLTSIGSKLFYNGGYYNQGVYLSTNSGSLWAPVNSGITDNFIPFQLFGLTAQSTTLYVGTINRIFKSDNYGTSWIQVGCDLPTTASADQLLPRTILKNGNYLYAMTSGGLFKIPI